MSLFKSKASRSAQWLIRDDETDVPEGRFDPPQPSCCVRAVVWTMVIFTVLLSSAAIGILIAASSSADELWEERMDLGLMEELISLHFDGSFRISATNTSAAITFHLSQSSTMELKLNFESQRGTGVPASCLKDSGDLLACLTWNDFTRLTLAEHPLSDASVQCIDLRLRVPDASVCLRTGGRHLYGGAATVRRNWPLEMNGPLRSAGSGELWIVTSEGELLFVHDVASTPWSQSDDEETCFVSNTSVKSEELHVVVCGAEDAPTVLQAALVGLAVPADVDKASPGALLWRLKLNGSDELRSQSEVLDFAFKITEYQLPGNNLEIQGDWESCTGQNEFDPVSIPTPKEMIQVLHDFSFNLTLWLSPFINPECPAYALENSDLSLYDSEPKYLDFANPDTAERFARNLLDLQANVGVDGFKMETQQGVFEISADASENNDIFFAMTKSPVIYTDAVWEGESGMASLLPTLLALNLEGQSLAVPMLRGERPDKEFYLRWLQTVSFTPVMQIPFPPWDFDLETVEIGKRCAELHVGLTEAFYALARQRAVSGMPINRPVWWIAPTDPVAQTIDSEFLLGDDILVAPVLTQGATVRDVYLPDGVWAEGFASEGGRTHQGPAWLRDHPAPLGHVPFFQRLAASDETSPATEISNF